MLVTGPESPGTTLFVMGSSSVASAEQGPVDRYMILSQQVVQMGAYFKCKLISSKQVHSLCVDSRPDDQLRLVFRYGSSSSSSLHYSSVKLSLKLAAHLWRWP